MFWLKNAVVVMIVVEVAFVCINDFVVVVLVVIIIDVIVVGVPSRKSVIVQWAQTIS